ncbi:MAG: cell-wall [Verrucomicrobia bacterium]|nr:cell-wall [Verrucomicrobiota bacterium]
MRATRKNYNVWDAFLGGRPDDKDWEIVEAELGYLFPSDLKRLLSVLGAGSFGCGLALQSPRARFESYKLSHETLTMHRESIQHLEDRMGISFYPDEGGMVLIASLDQQDFYLAPSSASSSVLGKLLWLDINTEEIVNIKLSFSEFIFLLYKGNWNGDRADELRDYIWKNGEVPFFTADDV